MIGAPALAARAALRAGAGLAKLVCPQPVLAHVMTLCPSATGIPLAVDAWGDISAHEAAETFDRVVEECRCVAIGPGLGTSEGAAALSLRAVQQEDVPVVVDADAINCLAKIPELTRDLRSACVLTPHPGEFRRLASALSITEDIATDASRRAGAEQLAQRLGCVVVLKGAGTVVTDGHATWVCPWGHACLATAGTGDVLTGLIAGLLAQHAPRPGGQDLHSLALARLGKAPASIGQGLSVLDLARVAVAAHARAGMLWAERAHASAGLLAEELADLLPGVLEENRG